MCIGHQSYFLTGSAMITAFLASRSFYCQSIIQIKASALKVWWKPGKRTILKGSFDKIFSELFLLLFIFLL